jgi:hypothetical protein
MLRRLLRHWLPSLCFRLALAAALVLLVLVLVSPWLAPEEPEGWQRFLALFARDVALRRTAIACAIGLAVTACVFFRPADPFPPRRRRKSPPLPPPPGGLGA